MLRRRLSCISLLLVLALANSLAAQTTRRPMKLDDLTRFRNVGDPQISPDGQWVAYASDESGALEVYVQRYPELGDKQRVSSGGGGQPQWRGDQRELFYLSADRAVTAVAVDMSAEVAFGAPHPLFRAAVAGNPADARDLYAAAADGSKFLLDGAVEEETSDRPITVIVDWTAGVAAAEPSDRRALLSLLAR